MRTIERRRAVHSVWAARLKRVGTDPRGIVHTVRATDAGAADITQLAHLLHGEEREVFGDQAYSKQADRQAFAALGDALPNQSASTAQRPLSERWRLIG
jgi:IS5 family transposase